MVKANQLTSASLFSNECQFKRILSSLGDREISQIGPSDIEAFLDDLILSGDVGPNTANKYRSLLNRFFKFAVRQGVCKTNPVLPTESFRFNRHPKTEETFSDRELARYLKESEKEIQAFRIGAQILADSGARISEMLALTFEDIRAKYIVVRKIVERHTGLIQYQTKGQKTNGEYRVLLKPRLRKTLTKWRKRTKWNKPSSFIVSKETGQHFKYDQFYKIHCRVLARAGLPKWGFHVLRRSYATGAMRHGFHRHEAGELLGHESLQSIESYVKRKNTDYLVEKAKRVGFGW